jgi:hypothetical protein
MKNLKLFLLISLFTLFINSTIFAQSTGSVSGQVYDSLGAVVVGATVTAVDAGAKEKSTVTNGQGAFTIAGLAPGKYTVRVVSPKFALYENTEVEIKAGQKEDLTIALSIEEVKTEVEVTNDGQISTDSDSNQSATVLKEKDLEALPDDPNELEAALQALAGPSAGPNGGQIYIDGFTGGRIPPKEAIREIRINQNPFSAEYDRLGFGRIEILTKPGSDKWRGQAFINFNDESLNSRNPFAQNRASSQTRFYGGNVSGPIQKGKSSFFLDVSNRAIDNAAIVNALILDPAFNVVPFTQEFTIPNRRFSISPRFDYQINDANTLVARYSFTRFTTENQGIGDLSLPSRGYSTVTSEHNIRLTETWIVNPKTVNETRFQYEFSNREQTGDNSVPTINVSSAFSGGGAQIGLNYNRQNSWELQNYTTTALGAKNEHSIKFGFRMRGITLKDRSESGFGGTFNFFGFVDQNGTPNDTSDDIVVSPLEQYRQKLLGNPDPRFNPNSFIITAGNPLADVSQFDVGAFISDDWRISPSLTLGFGLRYENQTNINSNFNFAPRFSFAYSPGAGGAKQPKTVFRGGIGIFYDRFSESLTLQTNRFDGAQQLNFNIFSAETDPVQRAAAIALLSQPVFTLNGVSNLPTTAQIAAAVPFSTTIRQTSDDLQAPYTIQAALGVERQLPFKTTMAVFYIGSRTNNLLRTRNVNAPVCPSQLNCNGALRPNPTLGNIYEYESTGVLNQHQIIFNFRTNVSNTIQLFGNYRLAFAKSDTDSVNSFPAYSYDLSSEYGTSSLDIRHNAFIGGSITLPWQIRVSPFIIMSSGRPFNITLGGDPNGDSVQTERPTFAQVNARCNQLGLTNSFCDISDVSDVNAIIPRNYGRGPSFFVVNMNFSRTFGFGGKKDVVAATENPTPQGGGQNPVAGGGNRRAGGGGNRGGGNRGGGGGGGFGGGSDSPYNLTLGLQVTNVFNNVNFNTPIGNLSSSRFGQSTSTAGGFGFGGGGGNAGNRRVELQLRFNW